MLITLNFKEMGETGIAKQQPDNWWWFRYKQRGAHAFLKVYLSAPSGIKWLCAVSKNEKNMHLDTKLNS